MRLISDFPDLHFFLSLLSLKFRNSEHPNGLSNPSFDSVRPRVARNGPDDLDDVSFWMGKLSFYEITGRDPIPNFDYHVSIYLYAEPPLKKDFFSPSDYFMINSNFGIFIFHTHENGYLKEFELIFREPHLPCFLPDVIRAIPVDDENPEDLLNEIEARGTFSMAEFEKSFQEKGFVSIEIE